MDEALLKSLFVPPSASAMEVTQSMDRAGNGIVLVVDRQRHLLGTVTDGDIRRAILAGMDLALPVQEILKRREPTLHPLPLTAPEGTSDAQLLQLMKKYTLRHVPLVDEAGRVIDLATMDKLVPNQKLPLQAVIMAGGLGKRLRPLTEETPKPMLKVNGRPLLERTVDQLRQAGIQQLNITTHYKSEQIASYFGDGSKFGVKIKYVTEDYPLGTAGSLGQLKKPDAPVLVINGDVLTQVNFHAMLDYHLEHKADLTVAVRKYDLEVPYGVIENNGAFVQDLVEKPTHSFFVNAGIYLLEPSVYCVIPKGQRFDMTDLIQRLLEGHRPVASFPIVEYWLDIGQPADYDQAQEDAKNGGL